MAVNAFLTLAALGFVQNPQQMGKKLALHLSRKVTQLLQDTEQSQERNGPAGKVLLLVTFQQWWLWASVLVAGALLLLLWLCRGPAKRSRQPERSWHPGSPGSQDEEEEEVADAEDGDEDSGDTGDLCRCVADHTQWPVPYRAGTCKVVEELVDELLSACQSLSRNSFKPRLQPAVGVGCVYEGWSAQQDNVLYRMLVPLQPPPGHAFCLELGTAKEMPTSTSCLRVQLQCVCLREWLVEDVLCFLHHDEEELSSQGPSLLNTLCTNSYLDVEKTASWFQMLVKDAWTLLPQSRHCHLTVLPTTRSCKLRLRKGQETLSVEMTFGVPLEDPSSFLSLE
ncbi:inositol 1,4,5-trisphosphate receptor-interacting protein-like 1 [Rhynochetos jubatus]